MKILALILALASPALGQVYASLPPNPVRYNDQYLGQNRQANNGRETFGDTRFYTQLSSGSVVNAINDGWGGQQVCGNPSGGLGENILVQTAASALLNETTLNAMYDYGTATCVYNGGGTAACGCSSGTSGNWTDGYTWKSFGIFSDHGNLYLAVRRQNDTSPFNGNNASLIMSQDSGLTWCNYTHVVSQACSGNASISGQTADVPHNGQSMWPTLDNVFEIWYCQDNSISCPSVDSNSTYAYLIGEINTAGISSPILMRVPLNQLADLNATEYTYWNGSSFVSSIGSAVPIISDTSIFLQQIFYDSTLGSYIGIGWGGIGIFSDIKVISAPHPWGPWTETSSLPTNDSLLDFMTVHPESKVVDGSCTVYPLTSSGDYTLANATQPLFNNYSTQIQNIRFCAQTAPVYPVSANHSSTSVIPSGLYQEFNFSPRTDSVVLDSSGQGHNGTSYIGGGTSTVYPGTYWGGTMASFDSYFTNQNFHVDTGLNYTGTDFTMTLVYNHQGPSASGPDSYEKLVWNGTAFNVNGSFFVQRDNTAMDKFQAWVDQTGPASDLTFSDNSWNEVIIVRHGNSGAVYDSNSFNGGSVTPVATWTAGTHALSGEIFLGGIKVTTTAFMTGSIAYYNFYSRALSMQELIQNQNAIIPRLARKGVYLPLEITNSLLDGTGPYAAWSLRKVLTSWSGSAVNITRASDSTSRDIGFDGSGNLDNASLASFCASTTCTVNTIYDQTGSGYNLTCPSGQATIYASGAPITNGSQGRTALFGGSSNGCKTPSNFYFFGIYGSAEGVGTLTSGSGTSTAFLQMYSAATVCGAVQSPCAIVRNTTNQSIQFIRGGGSASLAVTYNTPSVMASIFGDYYYRLLVDGGSISPSAAFWPPGGGPPRFYVNTAESDFNNAYFFEQFMFPYALNGEEYANLRVNQKAYYGTP